MRERPRGPTLLLTVLLAAALNGACRVEPLPSDEEPDPSVHADVRSGPRVGAENRARNGAQNGARSGLWIGAQNGVHDDVFVRGSEAPFFLEPEPPLGRDHRRPPRPPAEEPGGPPSEPSPEPATDPAEARPLVEVEDRFWHGPSTRGVELVGEFVTPEALRALLSLDAVVTRARGREWRLGEILVSLERRGPGEVAVWRVVGPPEVVHGYLEGLEGGTGERGPLLELGVLPLEVAHCCPEEGARTLRP